VEEAISAATNEASNEEAAREVCWAERPLATLVVDPMVRLFIQRIFVGGYIMLVT
jgi:hypothetical protein